MPSRITLPLTPAPWSTRVPPGATHLPAAEFGLELLGEIERDRSRRAGDGAANCRACMLKEGVGLGSRRTAHHGQQSSASLRLRMSVPYSFRCRGWPCNTVVGSRSSATDECSYGYASLLHGSPHAPPDPSAMLPIGRLTSAMIVSRCTTRRPNKTGWRRSAF